MCGFLAIFQDRPVEDLSLYRRALDTLAHRGPDARGEYCDEGVFVGHRRLSIIDLGTGSQPMQTIDGRYVIAFNGEIYNFVALREQLIREGAKFRTRSDTEVILEGYRRWDSKVVNYLHGMFAFVIWDRVSRSVFVARDRLGIKPLCWTLHKGSLIVSSTLEPFARLKSFQGEYDPVSVRDLMTFDYIPVPRTIYKRVYKVQPGSWFAWSFGAREPVTQRYWAPPLSNPCANVPDEFELEHLLEHAVERQMISDVPIGAFLSGGIDSSLLVAMMARHSSRPVRTFSVAFDEDHLDESPIAEVVANHFGTEHTVLRSEELGAEELLQLIGRLDEPFCDPTFVPTYALSRLTKSCVKVALSGDGADEVFGGYPKYLVEENGHSHSGLSARFDPLLRSTRWRPRGLGNLYWRGLSSAEQIRFLLIRYGDFPVFRKDLRQLLSPAYQEAAEVAEFFEPWQRRARRYGENLNTDVLMRTDLETYLSENCLVKTDRASMLASLEVRVPYLDETLMDRVLALTADRKLVNGQLKALLMPLAKRLLPREVWDRPKQGFNIPLDMKLAGSWRSAVDAVLDWGERNFGIFNYRYLRRLHAINIAELGVDRELWNPFVLLAWAMARTVVVKDKSVLSLEG
jgi:asparagine synthase (glutamine-hydrolysing)